LCLHSGVHKEWNRNWCVKQDAWSLFAKLAAFE
jgi:hypothetical protein